MHTRRFKLIQCDDREFLFPKHRLIGSIFTMHTAIFVAVLSAAGVALLLMPAIALNLASIPWPGHGNGGFLYRPNWSLTYTIIVPLIFGVISMLCRSARDSIGQLVDDGTIVETGRGERSDTLLEAINRSLADASRWILPVSIMLAILATLIDSIHNQICYSQVIFGRAPLSSWYLDSKWDDQDWMHGWSAMHGTRAFMLANWFFYEFALLYQSAIIFLGWYFALTFWTLTQAFASSVTGVDEPFEFRPFIRDPDNCLGLKPIGKLFSLFLVASVIFQMYAFEHRLELVLRGQHLLLIDYVKSVAAALSPLDLMKILELCGFQNMNLGIADIFVGMLIPALIISWWPLLKLRSFLGKFRKTCLSKFRLEEKNARQTEQFKKANYLARDMKCLSNATIWPNGFNIGWGFFFVLVSLMVSTIAPPLIVPLFSTGFAAKAVEKLFFSKS